MLADMLDIFVTLPSAKYSLKTHCKNEWEHVLIVTQGDNNAFSIPGWLTAQDGD